MSVYAPRTEPDVVLGCGCVAQGWPEISVLGETKRYGICETHINGPGKWGLQRILREASVYERILFREYGTPAAKRRSKRTHSGLPAMPTGPKAATRAQREPEQWHTLF